MSFLAFMMQKYRCMTPLYYEHLPYLWSIALLAPVAIYVLVRRRDWTRIVGFIVVSVSIGVATGVLIHALNSGIFFEPDFDWVFFRGYLAATLLPIAATVAALRLPKGRPNPVKGPK